DRNVTGVQTCALPICFDSVIDMLLHEQQVTKEMYRNQLDIIQEELAPHMRRLAKLKEEEYKLDKIRFCDLKAPLDPHFEPTIERKSTRLNSSHVSISYAVFCLKKKIITYIYILI